MKLAPISYIKGESEADKVMPYQRIHFMDVLKQISIYYRGWKTLDINHLRDVLLDYFLLHGNTQANELLGFTHQVEFALISTKPPINHQNNPLIDSLGATNLREAIEMHPDDDILMQIKHAETNGEEEKAHLLKNIHMISTELDITVDHEDAKLLQRKLSILQKRLSDLRSTSPARGPIMERRRSDAASKMGSLEIHRDKGLREIFSFYARQHMMIGKRATFEMIEHQISVLSMGEYMIFCKDFDIPLDKLK